ncbi:MAG: hypothetical protein QXT13_13140, partial [Pyrobaculum sp.]
MFSYLTEWGEQIIKFVLLFNLIYALVATAWYGATGLGSPYMPDWLKTQIGEVEVTNNPMQIPNAVQMMLMFTMMFATGLVQIVQLFQNILPPWLYAPLFAIALFLQTIALMYVAYRVFQLIRSLLSPLAPMPTLLLPLLILTLTTTATGLWFDQLIYLTYVGYLISPYDLLNKYIINVFAPNGTVFLDFLGDMKIDFPNRYAGLDDFSMSVYLLITHDYGPYGTSCRYAKNSGYDRIIAIVMIIKAGGRVEGGNVDTAAGSDYIKPYAIGVSQMRTVFVGGETPATYTVYTSQRLTYAMEYDCTDDGYIYGANITQFFIADVSFPNKLRIHFNKTEFVVAINDRGDRIPVRSYRRWFFVFPFRIVESSDLAISRMSVIIYQLENFTAYEFAIYNTTDLFIHTYYNPYEWFGSYLFFMHNMTLSDEVDVKHSSLYIREVRNIGTQGVIIDTLGHPKAQLRIAIDRYRFDVGDKGEFGEFYIFLSLGGKPTGLGYRDSYYIFRITGEDDPYSYVDTDVHRFVQQSFYVMYNPGDWLVGLEEPYAGGSRRFSLVELPHKCPHILSKPSTRPGYTYYPVRFVYETSDAKLKSSLVADNAMYVPLNKSYYYVVAVATEWGGVRRITYAGYDGVVVNNDDVEYIIYAYNDCKLVGVMNVRGSDLVRRPGAKDFSVWAKERRMEWLVAFVGGRFVRGGDPALIAATADAYARANITSYARMFATVDVIPGGETVVGARLQLPSVMPNIPYELLSIVLPATMALVAGLFAARRYEDPDEIILISAVT